MKHTFVILLIFFGIIPTLNADVKTWKLEQVGFLNIDRNEKDFGGFSGLIIRNAGTEALVVTDKSFFFVLELRRDDNDILTGYSVIKKGRILSSKGEHLNGRNTDSESIAMDADNNYYISFESNHRIMMHTEVEGKGIFVPKHPMFRKLSVNKGIEALAEANDDVWEVPYLPIDPADIGRTFEAIIRVNSQSGKAGAAYLLESDHHVRLPRKAEIEFSSIVQNEADTTGKEITSQRIWELAEKHYINPHGPFELMNFESGRASRASEAERITATLLHDGKKVDISATGNGPISAFVDAMRNEFGLSFRLADFGQNTRSATSKAEAAAYVELTVATDDGPQSVYGVGIDTSITMAPIRAMISALNKLPV